MKTKVLGSCSFISLLLFCRFNISECSVKLLLTFVLLNILFYENTVFVICNGISPQRDWSRDDKDQEVLGSNNLSLESSACHHDQPFLSHPDHAMYPPLGISAGIIMPFCYPHHCCSHSAKTDCKRFKSDTPDLMANSRYVDNSNVFSRDGEGSQSTSSPSRTRSVTYKRLVKRA